MTRSKEEKQALAVEAQRLRASGKMVKEIATILGVNPGYASNLLHDPDGSRDRARKASYAGTCTDCGRPTSGSNGPKKAPKRCRDCAAAKNHDERYWNAERVIEAIQRWAATHDGKPPTATNWNHAGRGEGYPALTSVYRTSKNNAPFARWADAIEAAGFSRPRMGHYERDDAWRERRKLAREKNLRENPPKPPPPKKVKPPRPKKVTFPKKGKVITIEELVQRSRKLDEQRGITDDQQ